MTCYVLARIHIHDPDGYEPYRTLAGPTVEAWGGQYRARGGDAQWLEPGDDPIGRVVVLEFPDRESALGWYHSPEYQAAAAIRHAASTASVLLVDGVA